MALVEAAVATGVASSVASASIDTLGNTGGSEAVAARTVRHTVAAPAEATWAAPSAEAGVGTPAAKASTPASTSAPASAPTGNSSSATNTAALAGSGSSLTSVVLDERRLPVVVVTTSATPSSTTPVVGLVLGGTGQGLVVPQVVGASALVGASVVGHSRRTRWKTNVACPEAALGGTFEAVVEVARSRRTSAAPGFLDISVTVGVGTFAERAGATTFDGSTCGPNAGFDDGRASGTAKGFALFETLSGTDTFSDTLFVLRQAAAVLFSGWVGRNNSRGGAAVCQFLATILVVGRVLQIGKTTTTSCNFEGITACNDPFFAVDTDTVEGFVVNFERTTRRARIRSCNGHGVARDRHGGK